MSPIWARRGTPGQEPNLRLTALLFGTLILLAALSLTSRFLPASFTTFPQSGFAPRPPRALAAFEVISDDISHTALRMVEANIIGVFFGTIMALTNAKLGLGNAVQIVLSGLRMMPLLCLLPFLHLLGFETASIVTTALCFMAPVAITMIDAWERIPRPLEEASRALGLTNWQRFWRLEAPFAIPNCITALARTMPFAWCMLIATEMLTVNRAFPYRPGLGVHAAQAAAISSLWQSCVTGILIGILACLYDRFLVFPLQVWADRYRMTPLFQATVDPWILRVWRRTRALKLSAEKLRRGLSWAGSLKLGQSSPLPQITVQTPPPLVGLSLAIVAILVLISFFYRHHSLTLDDLAVVSMQSLISAARVAVALALASALALPLAVWLGLSSRGVVRTRAISSFLTLYPKNILFPLLCMALTTLGMTSFLWPLLLCFLSVFWTLLAHALRGVRSFPVDLLQAARNLQVRRSLWWSRVMLPGLAPALLEALSTASMTGWSILILAEHSSWALKEKDGAGIGAYVARAIENGDLSRVVLGAAMMTLCTALCEILLWHPIRAQIRRRIQSSHSY